MKRQIFTLLSLAALGLEGTWAQRIQQPLGRGVVAVQNGSNVTVTWRRLAQEPETAAYNLYVDGRKVNAEPLTNTNLTTDTGVVPTGSQVCVTLVADGQESAPSLPFTLEAHDCRNMFMSISFDESPLDARNFNTSYVWPADLDGDGEMDYVVNRLSTSNALDCYVEGYLRTGEHLWTVRLGPNELSCAGQDDMILAYDMDCDGKSEVVVQTSDGTQFWDPQARTFGSYVNGSATSDTDLDGIIDYETQGTRNAPRYMTVVDGMTGEELCSVEQTYNEAYNRDNRAALMGDEYNKHVGHVGVFYPDGIHPATIMEWHTRRSSDGGHAYYNSAFAFDFSSGRAGEWKELFCKPAHGPAFHQIRIADVDGDGRDEMLAGGYAMDHDGETLYAAGIAHGDRFRTSDIDPERPGLETFAIQQDALLGQVLYDAATGEHIKEWYLAAPGDVGRGECMDIDPDHMGWEMWSTMGGVYDAKGELIPDLTAPYPTEGIWWDSEPDREIVQTSDSHHNVYVQDFFKGRLIEIAKISGYRYVTVYAKRAAFWGDIIGDWREELVLLHMEDGVCVGIAGFSTDYATDIDNIYCLLEDPAYRMQCTTKGYYQSPNPGFYLGFDMPRPPLPPVMATDLVWQSTDTFTSYDRSATAGHADGKSVLIDLNTATQIDVSRKMSPSVLYAMPVKGQTVTLDGNGSLAGDMELWKSQAGTLVADIPLRHSGTTHISEGTLAVNSEVSGKIDLRARGTLAGHGAVNDICFEGALNHEGGRIAPDGTLTFKKGLHMDRKVYVEMDLADGKTQADLLRVEGDLAVSAPVVFTIVDNGTKPQPGRYKLIEYTGTFSGSADSLSISGLDGLAREIAVEDGSVCLIVHEQRQPADGVAWTGEESGTWDYSALNFQLKDGTATAFVALDTLTFGDKAEHTVISVDETMPAGGITVANSQTEYTFRGEGRIGGEGALTKDGEGTLNLDLTQNDYTGATILRGGTLRVKALADGGRPSSIGAATADAGNLQIGRATLDIDNANTATNRGITLTDTATLHVGGGIASFSGAIKGTGTLVKSGSGTLNLSYNGTDSYSGGTVLNGGTLSMGAWNTTFGTPTSTITANSGTIRIFENNTQSAVPTFRHTLHIPQGKTVTLQGGSRCSIEGRLTGEGTLRISFPYVRGDVRTDMSGFKGTLDVTSGQFRLINPTDLRQAAVVLESDAYLTHTEGGRGTEVNLHTRMGSLAGDSPDARLGMGTFDIGYDNSSVTYAGQFSSTSTVSKVGTGTWTLTHSQNSVGVDVEGGTLLLTEEARLGGLTNVRDQAALDLSGTVQNLNILSGGTLCSQPGKRTPGTGHVDGTLRMMEGSRLHVKKAGTRHDQFHVKGRVTLSSPTIEFELTRGDYEEGEALQVFEGFTALEVDGNVTIRPEQPAEGLAWDLSTFATDATVRVVDATGIRSTADDTGFAWLTPNPTEGTCRISFGRPLPEEASLRLQDLQGKTWLTVQLPDGSRQCDLDLGNRPAGLYLLELTCGKQRHTYKLIKK